VAGGGDLKALHAARERDPVVGLDDQLEPGGVDLEIDDPEVVAAERGVHGAPDRLIRPPAAERADRAHHAGGDPHGVARRERGPDLMRLARDRPARRAAGTRPSAAPRRGAASAILRGHRRDRSHKIVAGAMNSPNFLHR
jgi:hypothetical protein